ncbi:hypothetical protein RF11_04544 [Thelohanellus kitauei]|uniref:Uncharacterized protein n=1 Tax=Thelohanellus kitauei TaxID=669202 RepID=A0A0C2JEM2_THEKT|nr:hypothetical protein RF11_04544 [Thelohanellus kitauei]
MPDANSLHCCLYVADFRSRDCIGSKQDKGTAAAGKIWGHKPSSLNEDLKRKPLETINNDSTISIDVIIEKLRLSVHPTTIRRWLQKINLTLNLTRTKELLKVVPDSKIQSGDTVILFIWMEVPLTFT